MEIENLLEWDKKRNVYISNVPLENLKKWSIVKKSSPSQREVVVGKDDFRMFTFHFDYMLNSLFENIYVKNMDNELIIENFKRIDKKDPRYKELKGFYDKISEKTTIYEN